MFKVCKQRCPTCIYRKDSPLNLDRLEREVSLIDGYRICHYTDNVCCLGFWNNHKNHFNLGRIAQRLNMVEFVDLDSEEIQ